MPSKHDNRKPLSSVPQRPPQPKLVNFEKKEKEGMLIDLTSPQQQDAGMPNFPSNNGGSFAQAMNDISILDAPIDVPTEAYPDDDSNAARLFDTDSSKPEPPPYQSPPTYMNTFGLNKTNSNLDPFDTSHITTQSQSKIGMSQSSVMSSHSYTLDDCTSNFIRNQIQTTSNKDLIYMNRPKPNKTTEIDEIIQNKLMSMSHGSPKSGHSPRVSSASATDTCKELSQCSDDTSSKPAENSTLSDSLKVNLSSLTLNDTDDFETQVQPSTSSTENPKLDRAFLAELEKEIYKNDNATLNLNVNNAQSNEFSSMNSKENTVSAISNSLNWLKNEFSTNNDLTTQLYSPQKNASTMQSPIATNKYSNEHSVKMANSDAHSSNMTLSKKFHNIEINSADPNTMHAPTTSQLDANNVTISTMNSGNQAIYSNYAMTGMHSNNSASIETHDQKYNVNASTNYASGGTNMNNIYSISSDIYGSVAGANVYDVVASSNSDYYQMIQSNDIQTVIYDEVAADDIRPHRPAPAAPTQTLSSQQIQRRIERAQKVRDQQLYDNIEVNYVNNGFSNAAGNQSIYEEINQKSNIHPNDIDHVSKDAVNTLNSGTIKNMKIEQLLR